MTVENFVRIVCTVFEKIKKSRKLAIFCHFRANFGYVSHIPVLRFWCQCACRGPFGCRMFVQIFYENRMGSFWEIWNFHKKVGRKQKQHDCSWKFFPTPKKILLNFCYENNGFCLKFQPSLFPKIETREPIRLENSLHSEQPSRILHTL